MRISEEQAALLKSNILAEKPESEVYLFGSRADDSKRGGDIDILILSDQKMDSSQISKVTHAFWKKFGEQKLDLVNFTFEDNHPFKRLVLLDAIRL